MIYRPNSNTTILDFTTNIDGSLDNIISIMSIYGISKLDENLEGRVFDVTYNTANSIVNNLTINNTNVSNGDRETYSILKDFGAFSDGFDDGFDSTQGQVVTDTLNYYYGSLALADINSSNITNLSYIPSDRQSNLNLNFNPILQRYVYAYPQSYGTLNMIRDQNGFDVTSSFLITTIAIIGVQYFVYYSDANTTQTNFKNSFYI